MDNKQLEIWLKSVHRNKHWWINPEGRWMDGEGRCVRDRGPASDKDIETYRQLTKKPKFEREIRYTVIKHNQLTTEQHQYLKDCIYGEGIPTVECVVVESDWPEYNKVWQMFEDRCKS